jgi:hypothetical protein
VCALDPSNHCPRSKGRKSVVAISLGCGSSQIFKRIVYFLLMDGPNSNLLAKVFLNNDWPDLFLRSTGRSCPYGNRHRAQMFGAQLYVSQCSMPVRNLQVDNIPNLFVILFQSPTSMMYVLDFFVCKKF